MPSPRLTERLFTFLWHRYVEGHSPEEAAAAAGLSPDDITRHRARRSPAYEAAEALLDDRLPPAMLGRYAKALQARVLLTKEDATAASVAKAVLEEAQEADHPTAITFVVQDFDAAKGLETPSAAEEASFVIHAPERKTPAQGGPSAGFPKPAASPVAGPLEYVAAAKAAQPAAPSSDQPPRPPATGPTKTKPATAPKHRASPRKASQKGRAQGQQ